MPVVCFKKFPITAVKPTNNFILQLKSLLLLSLTEKTFLKI